jgi:hypothetical protein
VERLDNAADVNENFFFGVDCPGATRALGGGGHTTLELEANMNGSVPIEQNSSGITADVAEDGDVPTGWAVRFRAGIPPYGAGEIHAFAICG